jgi:hypothetical protein
MVPALILALAVLTSLPGSPLFLYAQSAGALPEESPLAGAGEVSALARAWPDRIRETAVRDGEWMMRIDGEWFAWARGRLLPEARRDHWMDWDPHPFYSYPLSLPRIEPLDAETTGRLVKRLEDAERNPLRRSGEFYGALLGASNRAETEERMVRLEVAGYSLTVHEALRAPLALVSAELAELRRSDPHVGAFFKNVEEMNGYNYRFVEGTRSRSFHSYGLAVDIIPRSYAGKETYWMWAANRSTRWWEIPHERRWMVPPAVVEAFERRGFVWGGKWLLFDTMHFEYRPEILIMAGRSPALK